MKYIILEKDDESEQFIKITLNGLENMGFLGSTKNHMEALNLIYKNIPDIIFIGLDGALEDLSGFLLDIVQHSIHRPALIAISSSKKHAYEAFQYGFFDYILKPITELNLRRSILKYKKNYPPKFYETICLKSNKDYQYLNIDDILFLKADNNTTDFHLKDGSTVGAYKTLKTFENALPLNFLRIHKSYIINSKFISRIHYGKSVCIIKNPSFKIPFTKTFKDNIDFMNARLFKKSFIASN